MIYYVTDTHPLIWYFLDDERLSSNALNAFQRSEKEEAFEGKLVPQEPEDEPAERLLKRIEIERGHNKDSFLIHSSISSGRGLENSRYSLVAGWMNPSVSAWSI